MGFPYGADEDAAYMTAWLELHNLKGIKKIVELSNKIDNQFDGKINLPDIKSKKSINPYHTSLLMKGPGLFDYLYEETRINQYLEVKLENCIDPIFIIPLAKRLSDKIDCISINGCWIENDKKIGSNISNNKILIGELKKNINIFNEDVFLQFSIQKKKYFNKNYFEINKIYHEINELTEQKNLEKSLSPSPSDWSFISKYAQRTFVPASDESRKKGAGGGDDND